MNVSRENAQKVIVIPSSFLALRGNLTLGSLVVLQEVERGLAQQRDVLLPSASAALMAWPMCQRIRDD